MRVTGNLVLKLVAAVSSSAILILSPLASATDKVVHSVEELDDTLHDRSFSGRVIIPKESVLAHRRHAGPQQRDGEMAHEEGLHQAQCRKSSACGRSRTHAWAAGLRPGRKRLLRPRTFNGPAV